MYYLYVLISQSHKRHYIGITANLSKRLAAHNEGRVRSTKPYKPWSIGYTEKFPDRVQARIREAKLKKSALARKRVFEKLDMAPSSSG